MNRRSPSEPPAKRTAARAWLTLLACLSIGSQLCNSAYSSEWVPDFSYDASQPLGIEETRVTQRGEVTQHDITFASPVAGRIRAYLLVPPGPGPFAGVLYVHWLGDPGTSSRSQFLNEAHIQAKTGTVCLLVDAAWSDVAHFPWTASDFVRDRDTCVRQIKNLRRALDLLLARPDVDPGRVGYVGHDFGAMTGAQLAGIDKRPRSYVLIAGTPRYHYWFFRWSSLSSSKRPQYAAEMAPVDPVTLVSNAAPARILFQLSRRGDVWVSEAEGREFYEAATGDKAVFWYNADHSMSGSLIRNDRLEWLRKALLCSGQFSQPAMDPKPDRFLLHFTGDPERRYRLEYCSKLGEWVPWTTVTGSGEQVSLADETANKDPIRLYRAVLEP
jgi:hypothetical protein